MGYKLLHQAIQYGIQLHAGQDREGESPLPYITHPLEVLNNLRYVGGITDEDLLIAAVLHDVVEESGADLAEIGERFGGRAASLVKELTRHEPSKSETAGMSKEEIWQLRAAILLEEISKMSGDAQRVKLADRLANLREAARTKLGDKLERYRGQTYLILETVPRDVNPPLWEAIKTELGAES